MKHLIGKAVRVWFLNGFNYIGIVHNVEENLVFLTEVFSTESGHDRRNDMVINTYSLEFVRIELR